MGPVDLAHPCCGTEGFILPYTFFILPVLPKNTGRNWGGLPMFAVSYKPREIHTLAYIGRL